MTSKEYLQQIDRLDRMINNKLQEIYQIKVSVCGTTVSSDSDRVQTSSDKDKLGIMVSRIVDMEKEVDSMIDKRCEIIKQIESVEDNTYYHILFARYVLKKDFTQISQEISYSYRQTAREHGKALNYFEKKYENAIPNQMLS